MILVHKFISFNPGLFASGGRFVIIADVIWSSNIIGQQTANGHAPDKVVKLNWSFCKGLNDRPTFNRKRQISNSSPFTSPPSMFVSHFIRLWMFWIRLLFFFIRQTSSTHAIQVAFTLSISNPTTHTYNIHFNNIFIYVNCPCVHVISYLLYKNK